MDGSVFLEGATGRENEFIRLRNFISNLSNSVLLVTGLPGIGKSELTNSFARKLRDAPINRMIVRLNGDTAHRFNYSISQIGEMTDIVTTDKFQKPRNSVDILTEFITRNERNRKMLLIIDNLDTTNEAVNEMLRNEIIQSNCFVVINSGNPEVLNLPVHVDEIIPLSVLSNEGAKDMIRDSIKNQLESDIDNLSILLSKFPLALQLALAYIKIRTNNVEAEENYSIKDYLTEFRDQKIKLLDFPWNGIEHEFKEVTLVAFDLSYEPLKRGSGLVEKAAFEIIDLLGYFEPEEIYIDFLCKIQQQSSDNLTDPEIPQMAVDILRALKFLDGTHLAIKVHRLLKQLIRAKLRNKSPTAELEFLQKIIKSILEIESSLKKFDMLHVLSVWRWASKYDQILKDFPTFPNTITDILIKFGLHFETKDFVPKNLERMKALLGPHHLETLKMEGQRAFALVWTEINETALEAYQNVYEKTESSLGPNHKQTGKIGHEYAGVLKRLKKFDLSVDLLTTISKSEKKRQDEPAVLRTLKEIAGILLITKKFNEQLQVLEELLNLQKSQLGPEHLDSVETQFRIGICLINLSQFSKAQDILETVLWLRVKLLSIDHPSILATEERISQCILKIAEGSIFSGESSANVQALTNFLRNDPLALKLTVGILKNQNMKIKEFFKEIDRKKSELFHIDPDLQKRLEASPFGTNVSTYVTFDLSIDKIKTHNQIGKLAVELLYIIPYLSYLDISVPLLRTIYNKTNPQSVEPMEQILKAVDLLETYSIISKTYKPNRTNTISISPKLQEVNRDKINYLELETDFLRGILKAMLAVDPEVNTIPYSQFVSVWTFASKHDQLIVDFDDLADKITDRIQILKNFPEMLNFAMEQLERFKTVLGPNHPQTLTMESQVADGLRLNNRFEEAMGRYRGLYERQKQILGVGHLVTLITGNNLALTLSQMEKWDEAIPFYRTVIESKRAGLGEGHFSTLESMENLAECLWKHGVIDLPQNMGDLTEAKNLLEEVLVLKIRFFGDDHVSTLSLKMNLAEKLCGFNKPDRSLLLLRQVLASRERSLGPQHPDTVSTQRAIEQVLWASGQSE